LRHPFRKWQKNKVDHPNASKPKLNAGRPDHSNYFNYKNDAGKDISCCVATGHKLLTMPGVGETYTILMNTWNTQPESCQPRVYTSTTAIFKRQIRQAENSTPAVINRMDAGCIDNGILLNYLTSEVALEDLVIGSTNPYTPIDINCSDGEMHFRMAECSRN